MTDQATSANLPERVQGERTHLQIVSRPEWIEPTVEFLKQKSVLAGACSESRSGNLMIALHEALTNSIVHGNLEVSSALKERDDDTFIRALAERAADARYAERLVDIEVDYDGACCRWVIADRGPGFDVEAVLARIDSDDPEALLASGRGILLMRSFMDDVRFELGGRRVILTLNHYSGSERRRQPRLSRQAQLKVAPIRNDGSVDWESACAAVARSVSQDGIGLIQAQLATCDRVLIGVLSGAEMVYLTAEVKHCHALADNMVELGCQFTAPAETPIVDSQMQPPADAASAIGQLLDELSVSTDPDDERRAYPRYPFTKQLEIQVAAAEPPITGYSRDLSRGGVAFLTTKPLSGVVVLTIPTAASAPPVRVQTEILRCTKLHGGFFDVGGKFLPPPAQGFVQPPSCTKPYSHERKPDEHSAATSSSEAPP